MNLLDYSVENMMYYPNLEIGFPDILKCLKKREIYGAIASEPYIEDLTLYITYFLDGTVEEHFKQTSRWRIYKVSDSDIQRVGHRVPNIANIEHYFGLEFKIHRLDALSEVMKFILECFGGCFAHNGLYHLNNLDEFVSIEDQYK